MSKKPAILIVDDEPGLRRTLVDILKIQGFLPVGVATGREALDYSNQNQVDLALIDLKLGDIPGLEIIRQIKKRSPETECIVLTGFASQASAIEAIDLGAYSYVQKPYDMEQLLLTIQRANERQRAAKRLQENNVRLLDLARQLVETQETERSHLARELHDEIGQTLTALMLNLQLALSEIPAESQLEESAPGLVPAPMVQVRYDTVRLFVNDALTQTTRILDQIRDMSLDLRPSLLDDFGLVSALRWYLERITQRQAIKVHLDTLGEIGRFPSEVETTFFRTTQEALTNVLRHAQAKNVWVSLHYLENILVLQVADDGRGFELPAGGPISLGSSSLGLRGMAERAELIGAHLHIRSDVGSGTQVNLNYQFNAPGS
jgi:signal transduction histidine kinase